MIKETIFNEFECVTFEAQKEFKDIEAHIKDCVNELSKKYKTTDIEFFLMQLVSSECSEKRILNTIHKKHQIREARKAALRDERDKNNAQA